MLFLGFMSGRNMFPGKWSKPFKKSRFTNKYSSWAWSIFVKCRSLVQNFHSSCALESMWKQRLAYIPHFSCISVCVFPDLLFQWMHVKTSSYCNSAAHLHLLLWHCIFGSIVSRSRWSYSSKHGFHWVRNCLHKLCRTRECRIPRFF